MTRIAIAIAVVLGCGGGSSPTATTEPAALPPVESGPSEAERAAAAERAEQARRDELAASHRELEDEQATALGATCDKPPAEVAATRCAPSCYPAERGDPRAGKKLAGRTEVVHLVCSRNGATGPFLIADEIGGAKLAVRPIRGRFPKPAKKKKVATWQADVETAVSAAIEPELARGDIVRVIGGWKTMKHPTTKERLRCVTVAHYIKSARGTLDECGGRGSVSCEAAGNVAAYGINLARYRLEEARRLLAAGKQTACRDAALDAIAVARGMPRWRQYVTLNIDKWKAYPRYRTRFDGVLDEDTLFSTTIELGNAAEAIYVRCGGAPAPKTTPAQEHAFHRC